MFILVLIVLLNLNGLKCVNRQHHRLISRIDDDDGGDEQFGKNDSGDSGGVGDGDDGDDDNNNSVRPTQPIKEQLLVDAATEYPQYYGGAKEFEESRRDNKDNNNDNDQNARCILGTSDVYLNWWIFENGTLNIPDNLKGS